LLGLLDIGGGTHNALAPTVQRGGDALAEDVRGRAVVTGQDGDGDRSGHVEPRLLGTDGQPFDAGPQHVRPAVGVQGEVARSEGAEHPGRLPDRRGDVMELEVEEHLPSPFAEGGHDLGAGGAEQLQAHLGDAEPGFEVAGQPEGVDEIVGVEREGEPVPDGGCSGLRHGRLRSSP
jgi:hypothetical protein